MSSKPGNPTELNSWSSSLSGAVSSLNATVADLKAASPYTLEDVSLGTVKVTDGTTKVYHAGARGGGYYTSQTKWVTVTQVTRSGVAQNSGSFMTWLPGTVPSFGNLSGTWQGYAASMFSALLQDFVNTIEEIKNTISQISNELTEIATSINQSHLKWWQILLIVVAVVIIVITVVINIFFPGAGTAILSALSTGLRFLGSIFTFAGDGAGAASIGAIGTIDDGTIVATTEVTVTIDPVADVGDVVPDLFTGADNGKIIGETITTIEAVDVPADIIIPGTVDFGAFLPSSTEGSIFEVVDGTIDLTVTEIPSALGPIDMVVVPEVIDGTTVDVVEAEIPGIGMVDLGAFLPSSESGSFVSEWSDWISEVQSIATTISEDGAPVIPLNNPAFNIFGGVVAGPAAQPIQNIGALITQLGFGGN